MHSHDSLDLLLWNKNGFVFCRFSIEQITVKLGEYDFEKEGETLDSSYTLEQMIPHESYDTKTFENDIAILKLDRQV